MKRALHGLKRHRISLNRHVGPINRGIKALASKRTRDVGTFHKYPEIVELDKCPEILTVKEVIATEKLHGTNFRLFFPAQMTSIADVQFGARNDVFKSERQSQKFYSGRPVDWFKHQPDLLERLGNLFRERGYDDAAIYGEICGAGIQKGVRYRQDSDLLFRAFDICLGDNLVTHDLFVDICEATALPYVPEVWRGEPSLAAFDALLEQPSVEGQRNGITDADNRMEGVVIRSNPLLRTADQRWLIIKHKSAAFAEVSKQAIRRQTRDLSPVDAFARTYVLRGRILNATGRLNDAGIPLTNSMADMPHLVEALVEDLHKECEPQWQALREQGFSPQQIQSGVSKTLATVYRRLLDERA